jgi:alkanesulfonate monooxygenase SsuD/methylene tetrahydromethanopterin reductase-like flavin-dependent oxidoreductase (luciferase family)
MKVGLVVPQIGINTTKENLIRFVQIAEREEFESLWVYDRMLYAINPQQPYAATPNKKEWPEYFKNVLDPLTTLAFIAANTSKVNLGTCIIDMIFYNPITLSKKFTTIDILSEGRTICGFGIGWSKDEYLATNISYNKRGERANEILQAIKKYGQKTLSNLLESFIKFQNQSLVRNLFKNHIRKFLLGGFSSKNVRTYDQLCRRLYWSSSRVF